MRRTEVLQGIRQMKFEITSGSMPRASMAPQGTGRRTWSGLLRGAKRGDNTGVHMFNLRQVHYGYGPTEISPRGALAIGDAAQAAHQIPRVPGPDGALTAGPGQQKIRRSECRADGHFALAAFLTRPAS